MKTPDYTYDAATRDQIVITLNLALVQARIDAMTAHIHRHHDIDARQHIVDAISDAIRAIDTAEHQESAA